MKSFDSLKEKHLLTGIYRLDGSNVEAELYAIGAALDMVCDELEEIYRENFISTAENYGLTRLERIFFGSDNSGVDVAQRRKLLLERISCEQQAFTLADLKKFLSSFSEKFSVTEYPHEQRLVIDIDLSMYSKPQQERFAKRILGYVPAHFITEVTYSGLTWKSLESENLTFGQIDARDLTFAEFEKRE